METAQTTETKPVDAAISKRVNEARQIVKSNVVWALGVGVIPVPIFDLVGVTAVQIKMLKQLSNLYDIPFMEHKVKNLVGSLVGGLGSVGIGSAVAFSVFKFLPVIGQAAGAVAVPIAAGSLTYTIGKVFIQHFESGGTFLDFDPVAVKKHFRAEFEKSKDVVADINEQEKAKEKDSDTKKSRK